MKSTTGINRVFNFESLKVLKDLLAEAHAMDMKNMVDSGYKNNSNFLQAKAFVGLYDEFSRDLMAILPDITALCSVVDFLGLSGDPEFSIISERELMLAAATGRIPAVTAKLANPNRGSDQKWLTLKYYSDRVWKQFTDPYVRRKLLATAREIIPFLCC